MSTDKPSQYKDRDHNEPTDLNGAEYTMHKEVEYQTNKGTETSSITTATTNDASTTDTEQQEAASSVSAKAKESASTLKELIAAIGRKTKSVTTEKRLQLNEAADLKDVSARDARDIQMLGSHIDGIIEIFDNTMDMIRQQQPYEEQEKLLAGFKKVLLEEVNVINARINMTKRLKLVEEKTGSTATSSPDHSTEALEHKLQERRMLNTLDTDAADIPINDTGEEKTDSEQAKGFIA